MFWYCCLLGNMTDHCIEQMGSCLMGYYYMIVGSVLAGFVYALDYSRIIMRCSLGLFGSIRMFLAVLTSRLGSRLCSGLFALSLVLRMLNLGVGYC